ncbi:MAG: Hsp20/alpha crystallin family protein [Acidimicrobiia bacterium]
MSKEKREVVRVGPLIGRRFFDSPDAWRMFDAPFTAWPPVVTDMQPSVEEHIVDGELIVRAELPGIDPDEDAEIWVSDDILHIKAERRQRVTEHREGFFRSEFRYGSFMRSIPLPRGAGCGEIHATYRDGILEVHIPLEAPHRNVAKVPIERIV